MSNVTRINITLDRDDLQQIDEYCEKRGLARSAFLAKAALAATGQVSDTALDAALSALDGDRYQEIRRSYWKVIEGLSVLQDALEIADSELPEPGGPLINAHLETVELRERMGSGVLRQLGRHL